MVYFSIPGQSFYKELRNQIATSCYFFLFFFENALTQENKQVPQVSNFRQNVFKIF